MFQALRQRIKSKHIVVMHDFFIDRIVRLDDIGSLLGAAKTKAESGGGSLRGFEQSELKGGNAVNVAYALARLGARVSLITIADGFSMPLLNDAFSSFRNSRLLVRKGRPGYTLSLEVARKNDIANVMVSDVGDNDRFGPSKLGRKELKAIKNASAVMITNWASNLDGTGLALKAFNAGNALCFLDPADFGSRKGEFKKCLERLAGKLDVLSINENECRMLMRLLGLTPLSTNYSNEDVGDAAGMIAEKLSITVDVHTPTGAASSNGKETTFVQSFDVDVKISTGAGDVWDAADILGYLCKLEASDRLLFANACAGLYISSKDAKTPSLAEVGKLISKSD